MKNSDKKIWLLITLIIISFQFLNAEEPPNLSEMLKVDFEKLVSKADLHYSSPVKRSEEGMPVGNGVMGSLVWTTPSALKMQINRVDVFPNDASSDNFFERHTDYCGGLGFVDFDFISESENIFSDSGFSQHLTCYNGLVTTTGKGFKTEVFTWAEKDVMAVRIFPNEELPVTLLAKLRALRPPTVKKGDHSAISRLRIEDNQLILNQEFTEEDFYCGSAILIGSSHENAKAQITNENEIRFVIKPGTKPVTFFISSAASFNQEENLSEKVKSLNKEAKELGFDSIFESSREWWKKFWEKSFVHLHSNDGVADMVELNYTYFMYVMGSGSRGKIPPKFNGMLWTTGGDSRKWGNLFWGANQSCLYNGMFPANRSELMEPYFNMYSNMYESCAVAARQQWGSKGIFIPETVGFNGLPELPEEIADEMRALLLVEKSWENRSEQYKNYARTKMPFLSRWNQKTDIGWKNGEWVHGDKGGGAFGHVTHIFSRGAKIAYQFWMEYEYTKNKQWLKERAYPVIKGVAEFYRNFPNLKKEQDGIYSIHHVNDNESVWNAKNTVEEISSMRGIFPVAIKAAEILGTDMELQEKWKEIHNNLAPLTLSTDVADVTSTDPVRWIKALPPVERGNYSSSPDPNTMPVWFFDLCNLESENQEVLKIANSTFDSYFRNGINSETRVNVLSKLPVTGSILGRCESTQYLIPNQINTAETEVLANRMTLREGFQTTGVQRLGRVADALHLALFQSAPSEPGGKPVIRVFPAWPANWDASFTLLGRGNFLITTSIQDNSIEFIEIKSLAGEICIVRNPWPGDIVSLYVGGKEIKTFKGELIEFQTRQKGNYILVKKGAEPKKYIKEIIN
ncbi:MAG: hypothetical protein K0B37_06330 [Bacteroidales bacterium]|nr:hypothetical protein [Bacteroidales bacterium]